MRRALLSLLLVTGCLETALALPVLAQDGPPPGGAPGEMPDGPPGMRGPGGRGGGGGFGGPMAKERKLVKQFDQNSDGWLNAEERTAAREHLKTVQETEGQGNRRGPGPGGPGGPGGFGREDREPATPGPKISISNVKPVGDASLYELSALRTFFFEFENDEWESELAAFYNTDVEVPATLTVDGVRYPNVGIHFRGASSFFTVPEGYKRSLNVSLDFINKDQRLHGVRTLNLLNANGDPSMLSSVLYSSMAREHLAAPRANFGKVVINGESWGVYVNVEQFNTDFVNANFGSPDGARWKVKGSPQGSAGLNFRGDDLDEYKTRYEIKSKNSDEDWKALIELCRMLSETPLDELESALKPILDIDSVLWFLAFDNALVNTDGYWVRASDYSLYRDPKGVFHVIPHDMNESFATAVGGPGMGRRRGPGGGDGARPQQNPQGAPPDDGAPPPPPPPDVPDDRRPAEGDRPAQGPRAGGPGGPMGGGGGGNRNPRSGTELDPLIGMDDESKPLRSRLLAVPSLRARYLEHVRHIAENSLDWSKLGPQIAQVRAMLADEIKADTRKLSSFDAFMQATADELPPPPAEGQRPARSLRSFADQRRAFLLNYKEPKADSKTSDANTAAAPETSR